MKNEVAAVSFIIDFIVLYYLYIHCGQNKYMKVKKINNCTTQNKKYSCYKYLIKSVWLQLPSSHFLASWLKKLSVRQVIKQLYMLADLITHLSKKEPEIWENMHTAPCAACCWQWSDVTTQTLGQPSSFRATTCAHVQNGFQPINNHRIGTRNYS